MMTQASKILIAGELNVDLILRNYQAFPTLGREVLVEDAVLTLGSASALCASGLARLGNAVTFVGKVGVDYWGELCKEALRNLGVDTSRIVSDRTVKTGITVSITSPCDRAMVTYLGSIAALCAADIPETAFAGFDHLHISSFFLQQSLRPGVRGLFAAAHRHGLTTSLDPGCDPEGAWGPDLIKTLTEVDVFLPNEVELAGVTNCPRPEDALRKLANGRTLTVAKLGSQGCAALDDGDLVAVPAFFVKPIDTTGAGDSFNAGFLHAWLRCRPLRQAMRFAAACGALSTLASGGSASQATEQEADCFSAQEV
jgi:sugar/nucleoside kinase (ribokinase family)